MRTLLVALGLIAVSFPLLEAADGSSEEHPIYGQRVTTLSGQPVDLSRYKGKVLLIVNTASECGATPQYGPLQELNEKYSDDGLAILAFPCNQFGAQEPGSAAEIADFCKTNYGVTFDVFSKTDVNGEDAAPLFAYLTSPETGLDDTGKIRWNFEKFLVSRDGRVLNRFRTSVEPDAPEVVAAIEKALGKAR